MPSDSTSSIHPAAPRPPYELGLFIIHGVSLGTGATPCDPQALPGPQSWSPGEQPWQQSHTPPPQHHHGGLGTKPSSRDEPTHPHPATEVPKPTGEPGCAGRGCCHPPSSEGRTRQDPLATHWPALRTGCRRTGSAQEPLSSATAKAWVRTKNKFGEGRERDRKQTRMSWGSTELKTWTQEDTSHSQLRPAQPRVSTASVPTTSDPPPAR